LFDSLDIKSPKRSSREQLGWEGFFPYYAGFPEDFAKSILRSACLPKNSVILDPWNGSGTTTYAASLLGFHSLGIDLNPVMVVVARARLLPPTEADSLGPLARELVDRTSSLSVPVEQDDPLLDWYTLSAAGYIRGIEERIRHHLVGGLTLTRRGVRLDRISGLAATFYVALFSVCRDLASKFRCSNPTWFRRPKQKEEKIATSLSKICRSFQRKIQEMASALAERSHFHQIRQSISDVKLCDATSLPIDPESIDFVLTSPPYCTRIDYTAATRIELAVLAPLVDTSTEELGRQMIGSTKVPKHLISRSDQWGETCNKFLFALKRHSSKASHSYYYNTHLDYFDKMNRSMIGLSRVLRRGSPAIVVVQDSHYKDIHNDLPAIISEMASQHGMTLRRRDDFHHARSMSGINPYTRTYRRKPGAVESVLCFEKRSGGRKRLTTGTSHR
jgi:hypothetical protein